MDNIDFLQLQEDLAFESLRAKMEDGGADDWVTASVPTIRKYLNFMILEQLDELSGLINKDYNEAQLNKVLDDRILRLVAELRDVPEED